MQPRTRVALLTEIPAPFRIPLFNALAAREDIDLRVLFLSERDPKRPYRIYSEEFRFAARTLPGLSLVLRGRWLMLNRHVSRELRHFRPDVVIVGGWNQPAFWRARLYSQRERIPLVAWVESTSRDARSGATVLERAKRRLLATCSAFVVPGSASRTYLNAFGIDATLITTAPNAVDSTIFGDAVAAARRDRDALRHRLGLDGCVVLYVGRLDPEKGVDLLLRAVEHIPATLVVVGDGSVATQLRESAGAAVRFVGRLDRNELVDWYAAADVFALPSRSDQWGMVLNEAAMAGLPIVASDAAGGAHDLVEDGVSGFRVAAGDVDAFRIALDRLAGDAAFRAAAGTRSREIAARFTPDAWAEAVAELSRSLVRRD